jgi:hypothetical protein
MKELAVDTSALALRNPVWLLGLSKRETQRCRATSANGLAPMT